MSESAIPFANRLSPSLAMDRMRGAVETVQEPELSPAEEEEEDFVVYEDNSSLLKANETLQEIESRAGSNGFSPTPTKNEVTPNRREIKLETDDNHYQEERATTSAHGGEGQVPQLAQLTEEAINCYSEVPLLHGSPDGLYFNGLVFCDTIDSMHRPVVVVNTKAIPHKSLRTAALRHLREALEPVVSSGPYVLIFTSFASSSLSKLPVSWIIAAYRELTYPFRKNVQYVILVRPNKLLKALVRIMKLIVSKKAHSKVKEIVYLGDIESATNGEVCIEHLSPKVIQALGAEEIHYSDFSHTT